MSSVQVEVEDCISETAKFDTVYQRTKHIQQVLVKVKPKVQHDDSSSADRDMHRFGFENGIQQHNMILVAFITGNSSLEPLIEGLYAQIHVNLR